MFINVAVELKSLILTPERVCNLLFARYTLQNAKGDGVFLPRQFGSEQQDNEIAQEGDNERGDQIGGICHDSHQQEAASANGGHHQQGRRALGEVA